MSVIYNNDEKVSHLSKAVFSFKYRTTKGVATVRSFLQPLRGCRLLSWKSSHQVALWNQSPVGSKPRSQIPPSWIEPVIPGMALRARVAVTEPSLCARNCARCPTYLGHTTFPRLLWGRCYHYFHFPDEAWKVRGLTLDLHPGRARVFF